MTSSAQSYDLVCVGSGGGGLVAALRAAELGLRPIVIEKQGFVGGSTAMSGGVVWVPDNPLMRAEGVPDSFEAGMQYLQAVIGEPDQGSSIERREAYCRSGPEMLSFLQHKGVELVRCEGYADYYDNYPGGSPRGRSVEGVPWDGKQLGSWHDKINPGMARGLRLVIKTNEVRHLPAFTHSARSFAVAARVAARTYVSRLRGKDLLTNGMSLIGQLTKIITDAGIPIWLNTGVEEILVEGGRVVGVRAVRDGIPVTIRARAVLLSAGGFEHNADMRTKYTEATQPNDGRWSMANPGNTGEVLAAAIALGAKTDYMDEAVWQPTPRLELAGSSLALARQWPHTVIVNQHGRRFVNESNSYVEVGRAMYANDAMPAWLVFDDQYRKMIPWGFGMPKLRQILNTLPGRMPQEWVDNGWIIRADSIEELARRTGLDPRTLTATIGRFNEGARVGQDPDFGRGESQYNRTLGNPGHKPNPCLGPVEQGPFYALQLFCGDVGTAGGVITDEHARVLDESDSPIPGLYATGNMTATVMGRTYPGAGASIANTTTFGYIAATHTADALGGRTGGPESAPRAS